MKKAHIEPIFDLTKASDKQTTKDLKDNRIALSLAEARHFQKELGRPLTLTELTIFSIQGSEHCSYRSSRRHLGNLPTKGKNVMMGPGEDAGIIEIAQEKNGKKWGLVIGHESHNHPSQVVPYEGAATGIGGCVRDIVCMGARVIACLDPLRFGDPRKHLTKNLLKDVVRGIAGYGNPLGVPNLGGDIAFDPSFDTNCLVNVVAAGVLREDEIIHSYCPAEAAKEKYDIIIIGKPTDQSGFGGASFASADLAEKDSEANKGAVQEPNPFLERHLLVSTYELFDILKKKKKLHKVSFKDMGAGGNVCASVEQIEPQGFGAEIDLGKVHVANANLPPHVIACSETQERFCWVCHPSLTQLILDHYNKKWELPRVAKGAAASKVGHVTNGNYVLTYRGETLIDAPASVLTEGLQYNRPFKRAKKVTKKSTLRIGTKDITTALKKLLKSPNIASAADIMKRYDKNVQGATAVDAGLGGSGILQPLVNTTAPKELKKTGVAIGIGGSGSLGAISARLQAEHAVVEAVANVVADGATPLALTDCLNYGNPEQPAQMAELVDGMAGLKSAAEALNLAFVSGNVSLYNNSKTGSVNPSAIVAAVGKLNDAADAIPSNFQAAGNLLILVGVRSRALGASELANVLKKPAGSPFKMHLESFAAQMKFMLAAKRMLSSARDIHRGGLAITALEMAFQADAALAPLLDISELSPAQLFSENPGFLLEIDPKRAEKLGALAEKHGVSLEVIGDVTAEPNAIFVDAKRVLLDEKLAKLQQIWEAPIRELLS